MLPEKHLLKLRSAWRTTLAAIPPPNKVILTKKYTSLDAMFYINVITIGSRLSDASQTARRELPANKLRQDRNFVRLMFLRGG